MGIGDGHAVPDARPPVAAPRSTRARQAASRAGRLLILIAGCGAFFLPFCFLLFFGAVVVDAGLASLRRPPAGDGPWGFVQSPSLSQEPVVFRDGAFTLTFPRHHLVSADPSPRHGTRVSLVALATYPGMEGNSPALARCFDWAKPAACGIVALSYSGIREEGTQAFSRRRASLLDGHEDRDAGASGLRPTIMPYRFVHIDEHAEDIIVISCPPILPDCSMTLDVAGTRLRVLMTPALLGEWRGVVAEVRRFLAPRITREGDPA